MVMLVVATTVGPPAIPLLFGPGVSVSRWDVAWGGVAVVAAAAGSPILAAIRVDNRYQTVAHARSVAAALAMFTLWLWPPCQGSEGYLALVAIQGMIVLAAGICIMAKRDEQGAIYLPSTAP